jgi:hypothetical protein
VTDSAETSIEEFLNLELPDFCPVTNRLQKMLAETLADGRVNEGLAEILATMAYNLEVSLVNTKLALLKVRIVCEGLTTHILNLETRLIEAGVPSPPSPQGLKALVDVMQDAAKEPLP